MAPVAGAERAFLRRARVVVQLTAQSFWRGLEGFYDSDNLTYAASIAYYTLLSLFPFFLLALAIIGGVTADAAKRDAILSFVVQYFPTKFDFIMGQLNSFGISELKIGVVGSIGL